MDYGKRLEAQATTIPGLTLFDLFVHGDNRGWFKENWQRQKMTEHGMPDFGPVQNNISFNASRGIHAEPWDKYISVATGSVFGAWVDLHQGSTFGRVFTAVIDPSTAIFVPRGGRQCLPVPRGQHRLHLSGQRPLVRRGSGAVHLP